MAEQYLDQYAPVTDDEVREAFLGIYRPRFAGSELAGPLYDRWIADHDAQVLRDFTDRLTRLGIHTFDIHEIRRRARIAGGTSHA